MKRLKYIYVLAASILMVACQEKDDFGFVTRPAEVGEEILFGARAGFESANPSSTRTEYGDPYTDPETKKEYDPIKWVDGVDRIEIYSPQASNGPTSQYLIQDASNGDEDHKDEATLQRIGESSLQWGAEDMHTFYAMYPASSMFEVDNVYTQHISMDGSIVNGYIHTEQITTVTPYKDKDEVTHYTAAPDMRFAYMVAKTSTSRNEAIKEDANGNVRGVELMFYPIVTAVEFTLRLPTEEEEKTDGEIVQPFTITNVMVTGEGIAGSFTANLDGGDWDGKSVLAEDYLDNGSESANSIIIDTWYRPSEDAALQPVLLRQGSSLKFTVFVRPSVDIDELTLSFSTDNGLSWVNKKLSGLDVQARKKNVIGAIRLPIGINYAAVNYSNWQSYLVNPDKLMMKELSLPGTTASFSYGYTGSDTKYYQAQTLTFDQQWAAGIRVFEISTDILGGTNNDRNPSQGNENSYYNEMVLVNGKPIEKDDDEYLRVNEVVTKILGQLEIFSTETAVLIITYQPTGAQNAPRNPAIFMRNLMEYFNNSKSTNSANKFPKDKLSKLIRFSPELTMKEAQGKLMVIVRPTNDDEDDDIHHPTETDIWNGRATSNSVLDYMTGAAAEKILAVNGAGTGKDKWGSRGYVIIANGVEDKAFNVSNNHVAEPYWIEQYMEDDYIFADGVYEQTIGNVVLRRPALDEESELDFIYPTNTDMVCWFQEWARVVPAPIFKDGGAQYYASSRTYYGLYHDIYWFESYKEKLSNAKTTFKMAISGRYPNYVFINFLSGFLADGTMGNTGKDEDKDKTRLDIIPSVGPFKDEGEQDNGAFGGSGGNIEGLASRINKDFYEFVLETPLTGPTGIVLMDRILCAESFKEDSDGLLVIPEDQRGAYYLPRVIVGNNTFRTNVDAGDDDNDGNDDNPSGSGQGTSGGGSIFGN